MNTATSKINPYARLIEDAQTSIRVIVKTCFLRNDPKTVIEEQVLKLIASVVKQIRIERLAYDTKRGLLNFANRQYALWQSMGISLTAFYYLGLQASKNFPYTLAPKTARERAIVEDLSKSLPLGKTADTSETTPSFTTDAKGVPVSTFYRNVWKDKVKPTLDRLMNEVALDPSDYTGRNSLRNLAEMEVRYNNHLEEINDLKKAGVKLVVASSHADCSGRCAKWQGRVYSLDGTSGTTANGYKYVPLEQATDVYYTTKAGRVYKNGLLGFNCRHKLQEYKGELLPTISAETRKAEYEITLKQREMERAVRKKRVEALMLKDINKAGYEKARAEASVLYGKYKKYCHEHERAYYPMRVAI